MDEIPTISEWAKTQEWYKEKSHVITNEEKKAIRLALRFKTVKEVAYEFGRDYSTIYRLMRER